MRSIFAWFNSEERKIDPQTYNEAREMLARLECANHRLAMVVTAHNDYLRYLNTTTDIDHQTEFDVYFLNNRGSYTDHNQNAFKHRR